MSRSALVAFTPLALLCVVWPAHADSIFRCVEKNGEVVFRNFPCSPDAASTEFAAPTATGSASKQGPASAQKELHPGMSQSEVRAILGSPKEITQEEGVDGRVDTWSYGDARTLQFDARGNLVK
jgi:hypothetical protein